MLLRDGYHYEMGVISEDGSVHTTAGNICKHYNLSRLMTEVDLQSSLVHASMGWENGPVPTSFTAWTFTVYSLPGVKLLNKY